MNCPRCQTPVSESSLVVHDVQIVLAAPHEEHLGVLAHATVLAGPFRIGMITVRLTSDDRLIVTFPAKARGEGRRFYYCVPVDDAVRANIESAVLRGYIAARRREGRRT